MRGGPREFTPGFSCKVLLGIPPRDPEFSSTGLSPATAALSRSVRLRPDFFTLWQLCRTAWRSHDPMNATATTLAQSWFGLFPVRSPLLRESIFLSIPEGTKMFQFPSFPASWLWIHHGLSGHNPRRVTASKTSSDQGLVSGSPRLFAAFPRLSSALDA